SSDGSSLFGYVSQGSSYGFVRMQVGDEGLITTESVLGFGSYPGDLKYSNGRLYSYSGQVIDPYVPMLIGSFSGSGPQAVDPAAGRLFYLVQSGTNWQLRAFDVGTLQAVGMQAVANVQG